MAGTSPAMTIWIRLCKSGPAPYAIALPASGMVAGKQEDELGDEATRLKDELDPGVLDQVSVAGERFDRLLRLVEEVAMKGAKS
jgi:hypothetical protein